MLGGMTKFREENSFDDRRKLCFSLSRCGQLNVSRQLRIMSCCRSIELNIIRKEKSHKRNGSRGRSVLHIQLMSREIRASNIHTWICMRCVNTHVYLGMDPYMAGRISPDVVNVQASKKECSRRYISLLCFCERVSVWLVTRNVHSSYQRQME